MARLDLEKRFSGSGSIRLKRAKDRIVSILDMNIIIICVWVLGDCTFSTGNYATIDCLFILRAIQSPLSLIYALRLSD